MTLYSKTGNVHTRRMEKWNNRGTQDRAGKNGCQSAVLCRGPPFLPSYCLQAESATLYGEEVHW